MKMLTAMTKRAAVSKKLKRIERGNKLRVLDLFSGCGGMSLGFERAGMDIVGALEQDPTACKSHAVNFFGQSQPLLLEQHAQPHDITETDPADFLSEIGAKGDAASAIDLIVGGPPCQAFARIGRAKLREVGESPFAHRDDSRANLFEEFLRFVDALGPLAVVVENVPDMMNHCGRNIAREMCERLDRLGYQCRYTLLNSVHYGVPQFRERMFLIGYHKLLKAVPEFPKPTHVADVPVGYKGTRSVAMQTVNENGRLICSWFVPPPEARGKRCKPAVTCKEALRDLPSIRGESRRGARHFTELMEYADVAPSEYGELMRSWKSRSTRLGVK